jgi:hypothetical protein
MKSKPIDEQSNSSQGKKKKMMYYDILTEVHQTKRNVCWMIVIVCVYITAGARSDYINGKKNVC